MDMMLHSSSLALCSSSYSHLSSFPRNSLSPFFQCNLEGHININGRKGVVAFPRAAAATATAPENYYRRWVTYAQKGLTALALTAAIHLCPPLVVANANASEFDVLNGGPPAETFVVDDAGVINRVTKSDIKRLFSDLESRKGYHINCVTLRKLTSKADAFEFADQVLERWYPSVEEGNNKGVVLLVTTQKEGAVTGGPAFIKAVGDTILEGVVSENLPVLATEEKYNEAMVSAAKRLAAAIDGLPDPGGPKFQDNKRGANYKTKQETEEKRGQFTTVVGGLLVIAFVVPMAQYYAYVSKK